ncbi:MAG: hypothetical protein GXO76_00840 [Calditrichaeota bacterium]|nr:hypothetical protein [Calditrichota bacterium]
MDSSFANRRVFILLAAIVLLFQMNGMAAPLGVESQSKNWPQMSKTAQNVFENQSSESVTGTIDTIEVTGDTTAFPRDPSKIYVIADYLPKISKEVANIKVQSSGFFRIFTQVLNDKDQHNESFFLQIRYPDSSLINACDANLGPYKVVIDTTAPDSEDSQIRYAGTFYFKKGINTIILNHYAKIAVRFPIFWNGNTDSVSIHSNPESVHFKQVILIKVTNPFDAALTYSASADTLIDVGGQMVKAVKEGRPYSYVLRVKNVGKGRLIRFKIKALIPDSTTFFNIRPAPDTTRNDTVFWQIDSLSPGAEQTILIDAKSFTNLVVTPHRLFSRAWVESKCDTNLVNNEDSTIVYAYSPCDFFTPEAPQIQASSQSVFENQSLFIRVRLPKRVMAWDLRVHYADGTVDSSYGDAFIQSTGNVADQWLTVHPRFTNTKLLTAADHEQIVFELFSTDSCGYSNVAYDTVTVNREKCDLALNYTAQTDTIVHYQGADVPAVMEGESYSYKIDLTNTGPDTARSVRLWVIRPDSVTWSSFVPSPQVLKSDTAFWTFDKMSPGSDREITFQATVADSIPVSPIQLLSKAGIQAKADTNQANNIDSTRVLAFDRCTFFTPEAPQIQLVPNSVFEGDSAVVRVRLPKRVTWWDIRVYTVDGRVDSSYGDAFIQSTGNVADQWLTIRPSFTNTQLLTEANQEPIVFELRTQDACGHAGLVRDTLFVKRIIEKCDVSLKYTVHTDTSVVYQGKTVPAVLEGTSYSYEIMVRNAGPDTARHVRIWATQPDSATFNHFSPAIQYVNGDTVFWAFDKLAPSETVNLTFSARVSDKLPAAPVELFSKAMVQADDDTNQANNADSTQVFGFNSCAFFSPESPKIEVSPAFVEVGDSVQVRVWLPKGVVSWDVDVRFVNGKIDSSYADAFIRRTGNVPDQWITLQPVFTETRLITRALQEAIIFELHTQDRCGNRQTAQARVLVKSSNDCLLDRNVFKAEVGTPLGIRFKLSSNRRARIDLYDISGYHIMKIVEGDFSAGWNTYRWNGQMPDGKKVGSGVYIITIKSGNLNCWKKVILVR